MSSFFDSKTNFASGATAMALKEVLFGILQSKDLTKNHIVHASDFRRAVVQLGLPMGHPVVEEVLMHCNVSPTDGSINFSELQVELMKQRKLFNKSTIEENEQKKQLKQTSKAIETGLYEKDELQAVKVAIEKQRRLLNTNRPEIVEIFGDFSHHRITPAEVLLLLDSYGIKANRRFQLLIEDHRSSDDLSFREFLVALGSYDPSEDSIPVEQRAAGHCAVSTSYRPNAHHESNSEQEFKRPSRRSNLMSQKMQQDRSDGEGRRTFSSRREALFEDQNPSGDKALYKDSSGVESVIKPGGNDPSQMITHNKAQMMRGFSGDNNPTIKYNVEMKVQREQVLVALRRLDTCEINLVEFERRLREVGFDINPALLKKIGDSLKTGKLNWKSIVGTIDSEIFHKKALETQIDPGKLKQIKDKASKLIQKVGGASSLTTLTSIFHRVDEDRSGRLSFNEFALALEMFGVNEELSSYELRALFHDLDTDGDGGLDIAEFSSGIRGPTRAPRLRVIRDAFSKIDQTSENIIELDTLLESFNFEYHPDVKAGVQTVREAQTDLINFVNNASVDAAAKANTIVSFEVFREYLCNISFGVTSDAEFEAIVKGLVGLGSFKPKPHLVLANKTAEGKGKEVASRAVQVHGDIVTWTQEPSDMELDNITHQCRNRRSDAGYQDLRYSNHVNVFSEPLTGEDSNAEIEKEIHGVFGVGRIHRKNSNVGSHNIMKWDVSKSGIEKAKKQAAVQYERTKQAEKDIAVQAEQQAERDQSAGMLSGDNQKRESISKRGIVRHAIEKNFGGPSPYATGYDDEHEAVAIAKLERSRRMGTAEAKAHTTKSLSEIVREKSFKRAPKSLADVLHAKS